MGGNARFEERKRAHLYGERVLQREPAVVVLLREEGAVEECFEPRSDGGPLGFVGGGRHQRVDREPELVDRLKILDAGPDSNARSGDVLSSGRQWR